MEKGEYRLIVVTLIGNFLMIPSKIEIEILAVCDIYGTLGSRGLKYSYKSTTYYALMWLSVQTYNL